MLFLTMFFYGKMPRRIFTYEENLGYSYGGVDISLLNTISTVGAFMFGLGVILMIANFIWSLWHGARAGPDPWGGDSLEWTMSSPPPPENFTTTPVLAEHPLSREKGGDVGASTTVTGVLKR
jgi:cytochrome c oxidase subunit 1/cytochrome c oxidase subunit I+III